MQKLPAHLEAELSGRNPIDEPRTTFEARMRQDAVEALVSAFETDHERRALIGAQTRREALRRLSNE